MKNSRLIFLLPLLLCSVFWSHLGAQQFPVSASFDDLANIKTEGESKEQPVASRCSAVGIEQKVDESGKTTGVHDVLWAFFFGGIVGITLGLMAAPILNFLVDLKEIRDEHKYKR